MRATARAGSPSLAEIDALRRRLDGGVITPDDPLYDVARRVWNGMVDKRPIVIVAAASRADVVAAIAFAQAHSLPIAVRGGGHNVAGNATVDDGLVIDLARLNSVEVDPKNRTVRVGGGATLGDIDRKTTPYGLAVPIGVVSGTGIAGLTLGGGFGWLTRAHGLSIDNLLSADVVVASGELLTASALENPELFWAIRGGGGNFGIVSSFTFAAHPLPAEVFSGNLVYHRDRWTDALRAYEEWSRDLPDGLTSIISFMAPPPGWELGGEPVMLRGFTWAGDETEEAEMLIDRLRRAAPPDVDAVEPAGWIAWQSAADELFPKGVRAYWKNTSFEQLDDDVIDIIVRRAAEQTWRGTAFDIHHLGGVFGRVPEDSTPFPNRTARFWLNVYGFWDDAADDADRIGFVRGFAADVEPFSSGGRYLNFQGEGSGDAAESALATYGATRLARLTELKRRYDPQNIFRLNHNIPPGERE